MALGEVLNIVAVQTAAAALQALSGFHAHVVVANIGTSDRKTRALLASLRDPDATPRKGLPVICLLSKSSSQQVRDLVKVVVDHVMIQPISATALRDNPMPQINVAKFTGPDRRRAKARWRERKKILLM